VALRGLPKGGPLFVLLMRARALILRPRSLSRAGSFRGIKSSRSSSARKKKAPNERARTRSRMEKKKKGEDKIALKKESPSETFPIFRLEFT